MGVEPVGIDFAKGVVPAIETVEAFENEPIGKDADGMVSMGGRFCGSNFVSEATCGWKLPKMPAYPGGSSNH